jgi:16S rRNA (guanine527-N7)-methyltransferase
MSLTVGEGLSNVPRETVERLEQFAQLLRDENRRQSLISAASADELWTRHILDGAQLVSLGRAGNWCDIGSGPGLPGIVIGILGGTPMTLIEPRRLRADFLKRAIEELQLEGVVVEARKAERVSGKFDNITARAVAPLDRLFGLALHFAHADTQWILPKGVNAKSELDEALRNWQGDFRLVPSQTQAGAAIIVASHVRRRGGS